MKQIKLLLTILLMSGICYGQTTAVTQKRVFTYDLNPSVTPPTWSSKFLNGDWCFYTKDSSIYLYNATTKKWALGLNGKNNGGSSKDITTTVINTNGELVIYYSDGTNTNVGRVVGLNGKDGTNGVDGVDGVSIKGDKGDKGDTGATGPQGPAGSGTGGSQVMLNSMLELLNYNSFTGKIFIKGFNAGIYYGESEWWADQNTAIADYVTHFKSKVNPAYCWHKVKTTPGISDTDFGAPAGTKTLSQLGYTQADINALYDPSYGITTSYNADDAAHITSIKGWLKGYMYVSQMPVVTNTRFDGDMGKQNDAIGKAIVINNGNGSRVNLLGANQTWLKRKAASFAEAEGNIGKGDAFGATSIHLDGYLFEGFATNQTASDIDASYGSSVTRNHYDNVAKCIMQSHSMLTLAQLNIMWNPVKGYTNQSMYGIAADASQENSGGNMSMIMLNRVYATNSTDIAFETNRSSSPMYIQNIIEGASGHKPRIGINIDYGTGTTYKDGLIDGLHSEITCLDAMIKLNLSASGNFKIKNLWNQYPNNLIDPSTSTGYPNVSVEDMNWLAPGTYFTKGTGYWYFDNATENDLFQTSLWKNGQVPTFLTQIKHTGGLIQKSGYPWKFEGSMQLNGKDVAVKTTVVARVAATGEEVTLRLMDDGRYTTFDSGSSDTEIIGGDGAVMLKRKPVEIKEFSCDELENVTVITK